MPKADSTVADENPLWQEFARAMVPMMMPSSQAIADILGVAGAGPMRVLDIAAGHGIFGIAIAQRNPQAEIVAVDWAGVLQVATENAAKMGVAARHTALAGDAFKVDCGAGYDIALMTNFLHHFDAATNTTLLTKVAASLKPGGRIAVLEFVPNEDRVSPPDSATFAMQMLGNTPSGDAYTLSELTAMLKAAGFATVSGHPLQGPQTVVVGTKRNRRALRTKKEPHEIAEIVQTIVSRVLSCVLRGFVRARLLADVAEIAAAAAVLRVLQLHQQAVGIGEVELRRAFRRAAAVLHPHRHVVPHRADRALRRLRAA